MDYHQNSLPQILTANEVAEVLKISRAYAYQLMQTQQIPTLRIGRAVRVRWEDLQEFIQDNCVPKLYN
jgi:excisionase family DNA binding protein